MNHTTAPVTVDGFTIRNAGTNLSDGEIADIVIAHNGAAAPVTISNTHLIGQSDGDTFDNGIWSYSTDGALTLQNDEFEQMWQAVLLERPACGATVQGSVFHDLLPGFDGETLYEPQAISAMTYSSENVSSPLVITQNDFHGFSGADIIVRGGYAGSGVGQFQNVQITDNTIQDIGNGPERWHVGIMLANPGPAATGGTPGAVVRERRSPAPPPAATARASGWTARSGNVAISNNFISGLNTGIASTEYTPGAGFATGTTVHANSISGNAVGMSNGSAAPSIDASGNWWGQLPTARRA